MPVNYAVSWKIKMKKLVVFCTGQSGSGKSTFIEKFLSTEDFYNLKSATTRSMREGEIDGREYYFCNEEYFKTEKFATLLWVNEQFWKPGQPKWLYGVPEFEVFDNLGYNFTYDVIEPKYVRQMIDWFRKKNLTKYYDFKILWFQPVDNAESIIDERKNMPDDKKVRKENTCNIKDFEYVHLRPDFVIKRLPPDGYLVYSYKRPKDGLSVANLLRRVHVRQK